MKRNGPSPSYRSLVGTLPLQANNIYYRDQIGNISTSYIRTGDGELEMEIETRFPMFGGWQTQFYIGYICSFLFFLWLFTFMPYWLVYVLHVEDRFINTLRL
jgi:hypothetical protein